MKILFLMIYTVLFVGLIRKHIKIRRNINTKLDFNTEVEETIKYLNELSRYFTQIAFFVEAYLLLKFVWLLISILNSISLSISIFN
ncbi:hypothetical protein DWY98_16695 [Thomasclavelia ramosa]|nr:hypothetical protein DWY98_16695 [Thomasclavelia ramosa]RGQ46287.1 hypothetical protein DWY94_17510 [Thomasclavelia ramosa]